MECTTPLPPQSYFDGCDLMIFTEILNVQFPDAEMCMNGTAIRKSFK